MAIEGLDAALPIETAAFLPQAELPRAADGEPTLDAALAQAARDAIRESAAPDLWITDAMRSPARPAGQAAVAEAPVDSSEAAQAGTDAPADHPIVKEKLTLAEMGHMLANRQYDSTDYGWDEMSTADWEWATRNFKDDVYSGVEQATAGAASQQEAEQLAQTYLNSIGLGSLVHVANPTSSADDAIVITGHRYHQPASYMPSLWMDDLHFQFMDPGSVFDVLDAETHTIDIEMSRPLTLQEQMAVEMLRLEIVRIGGMLTSLPLTGIFTYPDGKTVTVAELRQLWDLADFVVTDHNYAASGTPGTPGAGAAIRNGGNPIFEVNIGFLTSSIAVQEWITLFYVLHELAHVTLAGDESYWAMYDDGDRTIGETIVNEAFASSLAFAIADAADYQLLQILRVGHYDQLLVVPPPIFTEWGGDEGGAGGNPGGGGGGGQMGGQ